MPSNSGSSALMRLIIGAVMAVIAFVTFLGSSQFNPVTGEQQHVSLTEDQEIALGLQSAPEMIAQYGGLSKNADYVNRVNSIGNRLVANSIARTTSWQFEFHVLSSPTVVNAFALPGGQVFITTALLSRLSTDDQIAGVLSHEMVHVLARHGAQQIAKSDLTNGLIGAVSVASGDATASQVAAMVGQLVNLKYGRADESQADTIGVCLMLEVGYNPTGMVEVMKVLQSLGGSRQPEFMSTHPDPGNRIVAIQKQIQNADSNCPRF